MCKKGRGEERVGKKFRRKEYWSGIFGDEAGVQRDNRATELQMNEINKIKWSEDYSSFLFFSPRFSTQKQKFLERSRKRSIYSSRPSTPPLSWNSGKLVRATCDILFFFSFFLFRVRSPRRRIVNAGVVNRNYARVLSLSGR